MKKLVTLIFSLLVCSLLFAQQTKKTTKYSVEENDVVRDSTGRQISKIEFYEAVLSGNFQFRPIKDKTGKVIEYLLVRCERKDNNLKIHYTSSTQCTPTTSLDVGQLAPDFSGVDMTDTVTYDFSYFRGRKVVVLNFWFTKCKPCIDEIPSLNRLRDRYKDRADIVFVAPTFELPESVDTFLAEFPFTYPILPEAYEAIKNYKVTAYPLNVIIDFDGRLAHVSAGGLQGIEYVLDRKIKDLLGIKEVPAENHARKHFIEVLSHDSLQKQRMMAIDELRRENLNKNKPMQVITNSGNTESNDSRATLPSTPQAPTPTDSHRPPTNAVLPKDSLMPKTQY